MINKIISGGQTGTDRATLDVAIKFPHGGWLPKGRIAEESSSYTDTGDTVQNLPRVRACIPGERMPTGGLIMKKAQSHTRISGIRYVLNITAS